ncbi:MAG: OmpH family outer membrane protein [Paludibacteraceae bacterium]|nr:OmpH family outer membrane protein [Paludibacteraceae bacterium]
MNKISIIVDSILAAAVVALFILFFTATPGAKKQPAVQEIQASGELMPIAIINTDSILKHYTLAVEASEKLMSRYEESTVKLDTKAKSLQGEVETFQRDVVDFQRKLEANAFLSRERAESEQARLQKKEQQLMAKQQDLENLRQKLSADFMQEQADLTQQLQDSVQAYLREYNADGRYHLVLNDAVLMNKVAGYDITNEVIDALNARYKK